MTKSCLLWFGIVFIQATLSTPAISKYDLNVGFMEAGLGKLEPERELRPSHVEFIHRHRIPIGEITSSSESTAPQSIFNDETDDDNEIDDTEEDVQLFQRQNTDEEIPEDTPQIREVINSFLAVVPKNSVMSEMFKKAARKISPNDSQTSTEAPTETSTETATSHIDTESQS